LAQRRRPVEIREALSQVDRLVLAGELAHHREDRGTYLRKLRLDLHLRSVWTARTGGAIVARTHHGDPSPSAAAAVDVADREARQIEPFDAAQVEREYRAAAGIVAAREHADAAAGAEMMADRMRVERVRGQRRFGRRHRHL